MNNNNIIVYLQQTIVKNKYIEIMMLQDIKYTINEELKEIQNMFDMGLLTPQGKFSMDFKAKQCYKMLVRMTMN